MTWYARGFVLSVHQKGWHFTLLSLLLKQQKGMKDLPDVRLNVLPMVLGSSGRGDNQFMKELTRGTCRNKPLQRQKNHVNEWHYIHLFFFLKIPFTLKKSSGKENMENVLNDTTWQVLIKNLRGDCSSNYQACSSQPLVSDKNTTLAAKLAKERYVHHWLQEITHQDCQLLQNSCSTKLGYFPTLL